MYRAWARSRCVLRLHCLLARTGWPAAALRCLRQDGSSTGSRGAPVDLSRVDDRLHRLADVGALHLLCRARGGGGRGRVRAPCWAAAKVAHCKQQGACRQTPAATSEDGGVLTCKALEMVGGCGAGVQDVHIDQHDAVGLAAVCLLGQVEPLPVLLGPLLQQGAPAAGQRGPRQAVRRKPVVPAAAAARSMTWVTWKAARTLAGACAAAVQGAEHKQERVPGMGSGRGAAHACTPRTSIPGTWEGQLAGDSTLLIFQPEDLLTGRALASSTRHGCRRAPWWAQPLTGSGNGRRRPGCLEALAGWQAPSTAAVPLPRIDGRRGGAAGAGLGTGRCTCD